MAEFRELTNAEYAHVISGISLISARESYSLSSGVWNPGFCSAEADTRVLEEIEAMIRHYRSGGYRAMAYDHGRGWYDTSMAREQT